MNNRRGLVIQERDRHLLRELAVMRVIDREQAKKVAGFGSTTRINTRLLRLANAGLLRRFFLGTTAGGTKALYSLSPKGAHLIDAPFRGLQRPQDEALVADFFVQHQLAINDLYCLLKYKPLPEGVAFRRWVAFAHPVTPALRLIPDGYVELDTAAGPLAAFLEVDLGPEGLSVWRKKIENYIQLAASGEVELRFGHKRFRILVVAPTDRRLASIRKTVSAVTDKVFWFATLDEIHREGFFAPIWLRSRGDERHSFIPQSS